MLIHWHCNEFQNHGHREWVMHRLVYVAAFLLTSHWNKNPELFFSLTYLFSPAVKPIDIYNICPAAAYCLISFKLWLQCLNLVLSPSLVQSVYLGTACYFVWLLMWLKWRGVGVPCPYCNSAGMGDEQEGCHSGVTGWYEHFCWCSLTASVMVCYLQRLLAGHGQHLHTDKFVFRVHC